MENIYGYTIEMLEDYFTSIGEKKFKASQVYDWLYKKRVTSFDEMTNIGINIREKLKNDFSMDKIKVLTKQKGYSLIPLTLYFILYTPGTSFPYETSASLPVLFICFSTTLRPAS